MGCGSHPIEAGCQPCTGNLREEDVPDEEMGENDPPLENPPPGGRSGTGAPPGRRGEAGQESSDNKEMRDNYHKDNDDEEDPKEYGEEDPVNDQTAKECTPRMKKGKEMARMFVSFCHLSKSSDNTIVVYFGVSTMENWLTSVRNTGRICSSSGRSATLAPMDWSER